MDRIQKIKIEKKKNRERQKHCLEPRHARTVNRAGSGKTKIKSKTQNPKTGEGVLGTNSSVTRFELDTDQQRICVLWTFVLQFSCQFEAVCRYLY